MIIMLSREPHAASCTSNTRNAKTPLTGAAVGRNSVDARHKQLVAVGVVEAPCMGNGSVKVNMQRFMQQRRSHGVEITVAPPHPERTPQTDQVLSPKAAACAIRRRLPGAFWSVRAAATGKIADIPAACIAAVKNLDATFEAQRNKLAQIAPG